MMSFPSRACRFGAERQLRSHAEDAEDAEDAEGSRSGG